MRNPPSPPVASGHNHDPDEVLTVPEWCRLNTLSIRTGRRISETPRT